MSYDSQKDFVIHEVTQDGLRIGLYSYNNNEPKLGINRIWIKKDTGNPIYGKSGRLTIEEMEFLLSELPVMIERAKNREGQLQETD